MNRILRIIGNGLIMVSLFGFGMIFYPILMEEAAYRANPAAITAAPDSNFSLIIPSLKIAAPVVPGVDPFNQNEYQKALQQGVAHAKGTALPGEPGTIYLFAHSSDLPWRMTRQNTAFYRLPHIQLGDEIGIDYLGKKFRYKVTETKEVPPTALGYLLEQTENRLILQTCTPIGTDWNRFLAIATPISN